MAIIGIVCLLSVPALAIEYICAIYVNVEDDALKLKYDNGLVIGKACQVKCKQFESMQAGEKHDCKWVNLKNKINKINSVFPYRPKELVLLLWTLTTTVELPNTRISNSMPLECAPITTTNL